MRTQPVMLRADRVTAGDVVRIPDVLDEPLTIELRQFHPDTLEVELTFRELGPSRPYRLKMLALVELIAMSRT